MLIVVYFFEVLNYEFYSKWGLDGHVSFPTLDGTVQLNSIKVFTLFLFSSAGHLHYSRTCNCR